MPLKYPLALWIAAVLLVMWGADAMGCNYLVHVVEPAVTDHIDPEGRFAAADLQRVDPDQDAGLPW